MTKAARTFTDKVSLSIDELVLVRCALMDAGIALSMLTKKEKDIGILTFYNKQLESIKTAKEILASATKREFQ